MDEHSHPTRQDGTRRLNPPAGDSQVCPAEAELLDVAAGNAAPTQVEFVTAHAAECPRCGPMLLRMVRTFGDDMTPEELQFVAQLQPQGPRAEPVRRQSKRRAWYSGVRWWPPVVVFASLAAVTIGTWWTVASRESAPRLIARAYEQRRTLELRLPGARYAPIAAERGGGGDQPAEYHELEALAAKKLRRDPESAQWLAAKASAAVLRWDPSTAIAAYSHALERAPADPDLLTGLAVALFERAETSRPPRPSDYGAAVDALLKVLARRNDDRVALFNLAVLYEKLYLYRQATETWERYLRVETDSGWRSEAERRLSAVRAKTRGASAPPAPRVEEVASATLDNWSGDRIEAALDAAVADWVQHADISADTSERRALVRLSDTLARRHHDPWLADLIAGAKAPAFAVSAVQLSKAARSNSEGAAQQALDGAVAAGAGFRALHNRAGEARSRIEETLALHRLLRSQECVVAAEDAGRLAAGYPWVAAQSAIERGVCGAMSGSPGSSARLYEEARALALGAGYPSLALRATTLAAGLYTVIGDSAHAWLANWDALASFWAGAYPPGRAYQAVSSLRWIAEQDSAWNLASVLQTEAVAIIGTTPNRPTEVLARFKLAGLHLLAGHEQDARRERSNAQRLLDLLQRDGLARTYTLDAQLELAEAALDAGELAWPAEVAPSIAEIFQRTTSSILSEQYYTFVGRLRMAQKKLPEAEAALSTARQICERARATLHTAAERIAWQRRSAPVYRGLVEIRFDRGDASGALDEWLRFKGAAYDPSALGDDALVAFADAGDRVLIWAATRTGVRAAVSPVEARSVRTLAADLRRKCSGADVPVGSIRGLGRRLYDALLQPVAPALQASRRWILEPDDSTAGLPFETLVDPEGAFLHERVALATAVAGVEPDYAVPSAPAILAVSVAAPDRDGVPALPDADREVDMLKKLFSRVTALDGAGATKERLIEELQSASVFHFAGHGVAGADQGALVLSGASGEPAYFGSWDLGGRSRRSAADLAVLAACDSAAGEAKPFNPDSLVRAFVAYGFRAVVASRWPVNGPATEFFMREFYRRIASGATVTSAVQASAAQVRGNPDWSHPYYWASFHAYIGKKGNS